MRVLRDKARFGVQLIQANDDTYEVVVDGNVEFKSRVLSAAEIAFDEALEPRTAVTRELRARETAHFAAQAVHADAARSKANKATRSGGKGGKGGV